MKRLSALFLASMLGACASSTPPNTVPAAAPAPQTNDSAPPVAAAMPSQPLRFPMGRWMVDQVYGADVGAYLGRPVQLSADLAMNPMGEICASPDYREMQQDSYAFLGGIEVTAGKPADAAKPPLRPTNVLGVQCQGKPFLQLAQWSDGGILARVKGAILHLKAVQAPPPPAMVEAISPPVMSQPEPLFPKTTPTQDERVYLASYKSEASVDSAWRDMQAHSPLLRSAGRDVTLLIVPGKGRFYRLFAKVADAETGRRLCRELGKEAADCGATWWKNK